MRQLFRSLLSELSAKWSRRKASSYSPERSLHKAAPVRVGRKPEVRGPYKPKPPSISDITSNM